MQLVDIGEGVAGLAAMGLVIYLKYIQAKHAEEQRDHKADVQTLFQGKK